MSNQARAALANLSKFIEGERARSGSDTTGAWDQEDDFIRKVGQAIDGGDQSTLSEVLGEFRGLSHYFGAYCRDQAAMDRVIDDLYKRIKELDLSSRGK